MAKLCRVVGWCGVLCLWGAVLSAQICSQNGPVIGLIEYMDTVSGPVHSCGFACNVPRSMGVQYEPRPLGCDPSLETCTIRAIVPYEFPGNKQNTMTFGQTPVRLEWTDSQANGAGSCGATGQVIDSDRADAWIQLPGFQCSVSGSFGDVYTLKARICPGFTFCPMPVRNTTVDLTRPPIENAVCPKPPKPWSCNESNSCQAGCMGANGSGAGGRGAGGASAAGGPPGLGGNIFGKAALYYQGGGIGAAGNPLPADWTQLHGRYWSHDYAERIVPDPDDSHVWLLTKHATFREFTDTNMDGVYDVAVPSDEYRELTKTLNGWELRELDGLVQAFDLNGRWLSSTDRNGNAKTATYDVNDRLERVDFPDGRHELFAYDGSGRLDTITEVGVDAASTRVWDYGWTGDDLTSIDRPDGRSWDLLYDDPAHPGFITRLTLIGDDGISERIEGAWEYDAEGNVTATWRGAIDKMDADAVDLWQFHFDDPALPVTTTVTDPLGETSTHTFGRDDASSKPRLEGVSGDCPTACGMGSNSGTSYDDVDHPLRPTSRTDGDGTVTKMEYNDFGQLTRRIEAFGDTELERVTDWQYDSTYPALVTRIERPSTSGDPLDFRVTVMTRDGNGNITNEFQEGVENGAAFSYETVRSYSPEGMLETVDGPDHGTADLVSFVYDTVDRGGLILIERIDPLIGSTTYGHDAFNRRTSTVDINGVETTTEYDPANRVLFVRQKGVAGDGSEDLVTENRYTTFGDLFQVILPEGNVIEYAYDSAGRLLTIERKPDDQAASHGERTRYELNAFGQRVLEVQERWESGAWTEQARSVYTYATRCHLDQITTGSGVGEESVTDYAYDCDNNLEKIWDANHDSSGQTATPSTTYTYDALDRLITVEQPFGDAVETVTTHYEYDVQDHLIEVTDGEGTVTSYVYSDRDLMTKETSEVSGITDYTYTPNSQLATKTDARGIVESRTYDALDRAITVDYPDASQDIAYAYDDPGLPFGVGRLASITRAGHAVEYDYDRFGRMTQDGELLLGYDHNGNRSSISYPSGGMSAYTFDFADREASLTYDAGAGAGAESIITSASYLPSGPLDGLTFGNGLEEIRPYDSRYFPAEIRVNDGVVDLLSWNYTVDGVGNPTAIVDVLDATNDRTYVYQDYQYFLTVGEGPWGRYDWTYDTIGNRLTEVKDNGFEDTYDYVPNVAEKNSPKLDQITVSGGIRTFQYDLAGNQTQVSAGGNAIDRNYDDAGRMSRQERASANASSEFLYDGRGFLRRALGKEPPVAGASLFCDDFESGDTSAWGGVGGVCLERTLTGPLYDSAGLLHAVDSSEVLYFAGRPVAQYEAASLFLTTDHLGTPIQATDAAMNVSWEGGFEPFGADYSGAQATGIFLRFPGQWEDETWEESGIGHVVYFNVNRWFAPATSYYLRPDPWRQNVQDSEFGYALQNSLRFTDRLGLFSIDSNCDSLDCESTGFGAEQYASSLLSQLKTEASIACNEGFKSITDIGLRSCVKQRCQDENTVLDCEGEDCGIAGGAAAYAFNKKAKVFLCPENWRGAPAGWLANIVVHELAHTCGWKHTDGQGVPAVGPSGNS